MARWSSYCSIQFGGLWLHDRRLPGLPRAAAPAEPREKLLVREDTGALALGDATRLAKHVALTMFAFEGTAAVVLFARFVGEEPIERAAWSAVFHSVSAFNNAGFDVMGGFHSLTAYRSDPVVLLTMAALIMIGGLSYLTLADVARRRAFARLRLDSTIVLATAVVRGSWASSAAWRRVEQSRHAGKHSLGPTAAECFFKSVTAAAPA